MAHFIGFVQGNRGEASRIGSRASGMNTTARGWRIGGRVILRYNKETDKDEIRFILDGGSNSQFGSITIADFEEDNDGYFNEVYIKPSEKLQKALTDATQKYGDYTEARKVISMIEQALQNG